MPQKSDIPLRQKVLGSITILTGIFILVVINTSFINRDTRNLTILIYGISVPMLLLCFDTLIDLDKKNIFTIWTIIGLLFLFAYFMTKRNPDFEINRSENFNSTGINKFITDSSTNSLKALPIFLLSYFILNVIVKRKTGNYIVNTFRQSNWYNEPQVERSIGTMP
jgi:hypothetical protein